ncbi:MAG TPA: hypothetical protein VFV44_02355 [Nitrospiraceae bacterium]|nr:hypothetical protein [Nitrospiraceae bacterium]
MSREPATTHVATDRTAFHILHPFTMVRYLPTVSSYRLLVVLKPPTEGYNVILCSSGCECDNHGVVGQYCRGGRVL